MNILKLFKKQDNDKENSNVLKPLKKDITFDSEWLLIKSIDFLGSYRISANKKFIVGYQDHDYKNGLSGGARNKGYGRCILLKDQKLIYQIDFERPNDPSVSNNGIVVLNDWQFGEKRIGTFFVITPDGKKVIRHQVRANLHDCGISNDGKLAWCTTAYNPKNNADSIKLFVFTIVPPILSAKIQLPNIPKKINLNDDQFFVTLKEGIYQYDFRGNLLNSEQIDKIEKEYKIKDGNGYDLYYMAEEINNKLNSQDIISEQALSEIKVLLYKAIEKGISDSYMAKTYRILGELFEKTNDKQEAINNYQLAIQHNPKVGCKKKLMSLKKKVCN